MAKCNSGLFRLSRVPGASWLAMACVASFAASPSMAQVAAPAQVDEDAATAAPDDTRVDDIIVTAQFRSQRLQDTPVAITALNSEGLAARGQTQLTQLTAPSLSIQPAPGDFGPSAQIYIRGVGQADTNFAFEPGVGIYIDDVYYSTVFGNQLDLLDLDRVEVLRGPQGTLAGKNSIGGAIKLYSKRPQGDDSGSVEVQVGRYSLASVRASADFAVVPDKVFARISGSGRHIDGHGKRVDYKCANPASPLPTYVKSGKGCKISDAGGSQQVGVRGQIRLLLTERLEINLSGDYTDVQNDPPLSPVLEAVTNPFVTLNGVPFGPEFVTTDPYVTYATYTGQNGWAPDPNQKVTQWGFAGTLEYDLGDDFKLTSITGYRQTTGYFPADGDQSPIPLSLTAVSVDQEQFTQEVRLNATLGDIADLTIGGYYYRGRGTQANRVQIGALGIDFQGNDKINSSNKSAFAHAVVHLTPELNLTGGIRYTDDKKTYAFNRRLTDGGFNPFVSPIDGQRATFSKGIFDFRAVLDYRWSDSFFTYAQFSTGFKGGGVNPRPFFPNQVVPFGEEKLKAYEIGFKSDLLDRRLRLNVSAFLNDYTNLQLQTLTPYFNVNLPVQEDITLPNYNPAAGTVPAGVYLNAGSVRQEGFEAELNFTPVGGFDINASLSYLNGRYTSLLPQAVVSGVTEDMELPFAPKWQGTVGMQYEVETGGGSTITPRLDFNYQSSSFASGVNASRNRLEPRYVLNAFLTYRSPDKSWEVRAGVTNLTNDFFYLSKLDLLTVGNVVTGAPVRPREWSLSVRRHF
jgi:iron complex outermembrane receptor protein